MNYESSLCNLPMDLSLFADTILSQRPYSVVQNLENTHTKQKKVMASEPNTPDVSMAMWTKWWPVHINCSYMYAHSWQVGCQQLQEWSKLVVSQSMASYIDYKDWKSCFMVCSKDFDQNGYKLSVSFWHSSRSLVKVRLLGEWFNKDQ